MLRRNYITVLLLTSLLSSSWKNTDESWFLKKNKSFTLYYTADSKNEVAEYEKLISEGVVSVENFFSTPYQSKFDVYVYPNRSLLDSAWKKDWNIADFKSECWMVASGVAKKIDMIAPKIWEKESCEHKYSDKEATQKLITHELFHVYHGQLNVSGDFSNVENIDWFVEGLATYASGQCDSKKITEIKKALEDKTIPSSLNDFWTGNLKYGLSGSVVLYIDKQFGRAKLKELLKYNKKDEILNALGLEEENLLTAWKKFITTYNT